MDNSIKSKLYVKLNSYTQFDFNLIDKLEKISQIVGVDKNRQLSEIYGSKQYLMYIIDGVVRAYYLNENGVEYNKYFLWIMSFL